MADIRRSGGPARETAATPNIDTTANSLTASPRRAENTIQPMPQLTPEQRDALRADIAANGVLVPVVKDQYGRILDGNNRAAIAAELGLDYPVTVFKVKDDRDAYDRAVSLNCARRHLSREQTRSLIASEIRRCPEDSDRAIARRVGCSPSTVGSVRAELRERARELTARIQQEVEQVRGQIAMHAQLRHRDKREPWQTVGDVLERAYWGQVSNLDTEEANIWTEPEGFAVFGLMWGGLFDAIRSYDCPPECEVCTETDRAYRERHPQQVYRWTEAPAVAHG